MEELARGRRPRRGGVRELRRSPAGSEAPGFAGGTGKHRMRSNSVREWSARTSPRKGSNV